MTIIADEYFNRLLDSTWGDAREFSFGVPIDGTVDPTGAYPKRDYFFGSSISQAARGVKVNNLSYVGSHFDINLELTPQQPSEFPFAQVNETLSGHSFELDDTPGAERILIKHRTGSGIELKPDGSIIISSGDRKIEVVKGDSKVIVNGSGDMIYDGDLNMRVSGDYNLRVGGNFDVVVGANLEEDIVGSRKSFVGQTRSDITKGPKDTRTYGPSVDLRLSSHHDITKGTLDQIIGGSLNTHVANRIDFSADKMHTAINKYSVASNDLKLSGINGFIGGTNINHYGRVYTGPDSDGARGGGVTYYGSLVGRAFEAWTSKYSLYADESYEAHVSNYATIAEWADESRTTKHQQYAENLVGSLGAAQYPTNVDGATPKDGSKNLNKDPAFYYGVGHNVVGEDSSGIVWNVQAPDSDGQRQVPPGYVDSSGREDFPEGATTQWLILERTRNGIKKVAVDPTAGLTDKIGLIKYYDFFTHEPTLPEVRSKLRSFTTNYSSLSYEQKQCARALLDKGRLSKRWRTTPPAEVVSEVARADIINRIGKTTLGNPNETKSKSFKFDITQIPAEYNLIFDPKYSVLGRGLQLDTYKSGDHLSKTITLGNFLGTVGNATSLDRIPLREDRTRIIRHLQLHAQIMEKVNNSAEFEGYNFIVIEGVYVPSSLTESNIIRFGPSTPTTNWANWNKHKQTGRTVVYKLIGKDGLVAWDKTFELAVWLRENVVYDEIALDYDTYNYDGVPTVQIVVNVPDTFNSYGSAMLTVEPKYRLSTWWNQKRTHNGKLCKWEDPYARASDLIDPIEAPRFDLSNDDVTVTIGDLPGNRPSFTSVLGDGSWSGKSLGKSNIEWDDDTKSMVTLTFASAVSVNIDAKISSESGFDRGKIYVNGTLVDDIMNNGNFSGIGTVKYDGTNIAFQEFDEDYDDVTELKFEYIKDGSVSLGDDELKVNVTWS